MQLTLKNIVFRKNLQNKIDLSISGSGEIHIDILDANKATVGISGSGDIFLGGANTLSFCLPG